MLKERIKKDLKKSLKKGEKEVVSTLRFLLSEMTKQRKEKRRRLSEQKDLSPKELAEKSRLTEEEVIKTISTQVKKGKEAVREFEEGDRADLVKKEKRQIEILSDYLPEQLSKEEIREKAERAVEELGAEGMEDMGAVMKEMMKKVKGRASGARVAEAVKGILSS